MVTVAVADEAAERRRRRGVRPLPDGLVLGAFLVPALVLLGVTQFWPLAASFGISLHDWTLARSPVMGEFVGAANYARVLSDGQFTGALGFTLALALGSTALSLAAGLALALLTVGEDGRLRLVRALLLFPMVIAPVAVGTIWRMILSARVGTLNGMLGALGLPQPNWLGDPMLARISLAVIDAWQWTPFVMVVMAAALTALPADVLRAARMDGAGRALVFRRITLPLILPTLMLVGMFRLVDALMTLDIVVTTTGGGPGFATQTLSWWIYQQGLRYFNLSVAAAASWLLLALCFGVAALMLLARRRAARWLP
ncbi:carbohydrate ABC transporter permease [Rubellimicrobium sp. CFH 75288]|uniref:carbohydrate ABC transporter permease n=1 Tax=Rubellimicrobium sp. CFH 75288 TaxID=2697034 RepID=UPI001411D0DB|nr:sugar ABC transporter permease [Rubellimicrobium sp. CFH 75288]NAZ36585.1 ABC transporter permease subunit [Rubellimicrobium sp. CFH 75288]